MIARLHLFLARHPWWVLVSTCAFAAVALVAARGLRTSEDYTDMLPMSDPAIAEQFEALKQVRQADRLFVDIHTLGDDPAMLTEAAERFTRALESIPELTNVRGSFDGEDALEIYEAVQARLPFLLSGEELDKLKPKLEPKAIRDRLDWFKKSLSQPQGLMLQQAAQRDPVGLGDPVMNHLRALQSGSGDARIVAGRITSADGRHVLVTAQPAFRPSETGRSKRLVERVVKSADEVEVGFPKGAIEIAVSGAHRISLDNASIIAMDSARTSVVATCAVAALMLVAYGRRWLSLLGLIPTALGGLVALVAFYLIGEPVSAIALGCGSILIGVTVDYGIYVLYHCDDSPTATREEMARSVAQMASTVAFGAVTTMAAFLAMFASPISGHRQLGIFGLVAVATAGASALLLLPVFVPVRAARAQPLPLTRLMEGFYRYRAGHNRWILGALVLLSVLCVLGVWRLRFDGDLNRFNGVSPATATAEKTIRDTWGKALSLTTIVVSGTNLDEALGKNERVYAVMSGLQASNLVQGVSSIAPLCPSRETQARNFREWQSFWSAERRGQVSNALVSASAELGFNADSFAGFLERIAPGNAMPGAIAANAMGLGRLQADFTGEKNGRVSLITLAKVRDTSDYRRVHAAVTGGIPDALLINKAALTEEITRIARRGLPVFAALVVALNVVLLFLFLGRLSLVLITLLPMLTGVFWSLGIMGLAGMPVDMSNFIFVVLVIGLSGDYSLFLVTSEVSALRGLPGRVPATAAAVTVCALTTIFGVGVLVLARHPALFSVGLSALLGISLSLLAALILVPLCMAALRRHVAQAMAAAVKTGDTEPKSLVDRVGRLYRYQEPYVARFASWKLRLDPLFTHLDEAVPKQGQILELGCGYGLAAHWLTLASADRTVLGFDNDVGKIRAARASAAANPRVQFEERDVLNGDYPPCDCVLMLDLLHYLPRDRKAEVLKKASAALGPTGVLVLRDAFGAATGKHRLVEFSEKWGVRLGQNKTAYGLHFETREEHLNLLRAAGFCEIHEQRGSGLGSNAMVVCRKTDAV